MPTIKRNILYISWNGSENYIKIQDAANTMNNGDIVFVYHGSYSEDADIDKIINLIGED